MARIKHIAIATQDVEGTARFYMDVLGLEKAGDVNSPNASGYYLTDGHINLAILNFKNDDVAGPEYGTGYSGIHHIGFQVENLEEIAEKLAAAGSKPRDDVNQALGVGQHGHRYANVEVKYSGPDNVMVDVSTVPALLADHGVEAEVRDAFGDESLPVGLKAIVGRKAG